MILWTSFKLLNVRDELCSKILYLKSPRLGRKKNKNILLRNGSDSFCTLDLLSIKFCLKSRFFLTSSWVLSKPKRAWRYQNWGRQMKFDRFKFRTYLNIFTRGKKKFEDSNQRKPKFHPSSGLFYWDKICTKCNLYYFWLLV